MSITVKGMRFYPTGQLTSIPFHSFMGSRRKHKIPVVVQLLSPVWLFVNPRTAACQASLSFTISQSLLKFMSIELVMLSNHLILCCPLLLLPAFFPSIRVFSNELARHIRQLKYWSFSFSISPSNEYSGLISFTIDWFDILVVQGTPKSLLQHHNSKVLSLLYGPTLNIHTWLLKRSIAWLYGPL